MSILFFQRGNWAKEEWCDLLKMKCSASGGQETRTPVLWLQHLCSPTQDPSLWRRGCVTCTWRWLGAMRCLWKYMWWFYLSEHIYVWEEKKISCIPWVWSCSFIERYKAPAYQCFPFLTKLSVSVVLVLIYLISGTFLPSKSPVCTFSPGVCR